jgi:monofunctional biosynthetic peptidoglycan transglycosylase
MGYNGSQLKGSTKFLLRVKGDGNIYKLRFRIGGSYANYSADFSTIKDEWIDIEIPIEELKPYYFGRKTRAPRFKIHKINSIGILISDKQSGSFSLEVEHLKAL